MESRFNIELPHLVNEMNRRFLDFLGAFPTHQCAGEREYRFGCVLKIFVTRLIKELFYRVDQDVMVLR